MSNTEFSPGGQYSGENWTVRRCTSSTGESYDECAGNPCSSLAVKDIIKAIKNRDNADGSTRQHARAITSRDLEKIWDWSEAECSEELIQHVLHDTNVTLDDYIKVYQHLQWRTTSALMNNLWMRSVNHDFTQLILVAHLPNIGAKSWGSGSETWTSMVTPMSGSSLTSMSTL